MITEPRSSHEPAGGDGLLFLISMAIIAVVSVEGLFIAFSSWWLMVLVLLVVIGAAVGVSAALVRLIDHDSPLAAPRLAPAEPVVAVRSGALQAMRRPISAVE
jgi:hypothetical protein